MFDQEAREAALLPCPFCGNAPEQVTEYDYISGADARGGGLGMSGGNVSRQKVVCRTCGAQAQPPNPYTQFSWNCRVLTSTKAEPSRIAEIREQHARDEATFTKHPSISGSLERWLRSTHEALGKALSHITAIEAERCLSCGVKPGKIDCDPGTSNVELRQEIESLQSERDRMREALERAEAAANVAMKYAEQERKLATVPATMEYQVGHVLTAIKSAALNPSKPGEG